MSTLIDIAIGNVLRAGVRVNFCKKYEQKWMLVKLGTVNCSTHYRIHK